MPKILGPDFSLFLCLKEEEMFLHLLCMSWQALGEQGVGRAAGLASVCMGSSGSTSERGQLISHECQHSCEARRLVD